MLLKFLFLGAKVGDRVPAVSVIMNCLNGARYLREALESVYAQTFQDWEIVFWDNASTDNSAAIAKSYDRRLRYFRSAGTVSLGRARNLALAEAKGEYLAFLDCDDLWLPEKLEKQVKLFRQFPELGLVFSDTLFFNEEVSFPLYGPRTPPKGEVFRALLAHYFLSLETVMVRRSALFSLQEWFDESLEVTEEEEIFLRLAFKFPFGYVPEVLAKWRMHEASWTHSRDDLFSKEEKYILEKLRRMIPRFHQEYSEEIALFERKIARQSALALWKRGKGGEARRELFKYLGDKKLTLLYLATFLPSSCHSFLQKFYRQRRAAP